MLGRDNIRWVKSQQDRLKSALRKYNATISKAEKAQPELVQFLPEKLYYKDTKGQVQTAKELNALIKSLNRVVKSGIEVIETEGGVTTTNIELERVQGLYNKVEREKRQRRLKLEKARTPGRMGTEAEASLRPRTLKPYNVKLEGWETFVKTLERQAAPEYWGERDEQYKENYIEGLWRNFGTRSDTLEVVEIMQKIPAATMLLAAQQNPNLVFDFMYPHSEEERADHLEAIRDGWLEYA